MAKSVSLYETLTESIDLITNPATHAQKPSSKSEETDLMSGIPNSLVILVIAALPRTR